jgi:nucleoid-associated protein YgaU
MTAMTLNPSVGTRSTPPGRASVRPAVPAARPVPCGVRPAPHGEELRLTRRGRVVVTLILLAFALVAFTLFSAQSAATGEEGAEVGTRTVIVGEGDTLWEIAGAVAAPGETREVVYEIQKLNSLPGPELVEGQKLAVPAP